MTDNEKRMVIMREALEAIWEMDEDEPYETIRVMQKIALTALEKADFAAPYYTKEDHSS